MVKTLKTLVIAATGASLALTPVAAQANTRAGDRPVIYDAPLSQAASQPGTGRAAEGEELAGGVGSLFIGFLMGLWTSGILILAFDEDEHKTQSPGT